MFFRSSNSLYDHYTHTQTQYTRTDGRTEERERESQPYAHVWLMRECVRVCGAARSLASAEIMNIIKTVLYGNSSEVVVSIGNCFCHRRTAAPAALNGAHTHKSQQSRETSTKSIKQPPSEAAAAAETAAIHRLDSLSHSLSLSPVSVVISYSSFQFALAAAGETVSQSHVDDDDNSACCSGARPVLLFFFFFFLSLIRIQRLHSNAKG